MDPTALAPVGKNGVRVSRLGLGGAALGNLFAAVDDATAQITIRAALDAGLRFVDTAPYYGHGLSEHRFGEALRGRDRASFVLATKVGRLLVPHHGSPQEPTGFVATLPFRPVYDYSYAGVMRSYEASLQRLGVDRIDVLFMHDIGAYTHGERHAERFAVAMDGGYRALAELRRSGDVKAIGLGVNECAVCIDALERGDFDAFLLAGRYTLLEQGALDALLPRCVARGVSIVVGGPYNSGLLASEPKRGATYDYAEAPDPILSRARALFEACAEHGVPLQAAALQFPLLHPAVASVIPGPRSPRELHENLRWFEMPIPAALWSDLKARGLLREDAPTGP